jgi:hypothetical protein
MLILCEKGGSMKRIAIPVLLCSSLLVAKSVPIKASLSLGGNSDIIIIKKPKQIVFSEKGKAVKIFDQTLWQSNNSLLEEAKNHLGKEYVWGANGPSAFDCSGFVCYVCKKKGIELPRTSMMQAQIGKKVDRKHLKAGDLLFFDTSKEEKGEITHVGIYLGNGKFIHASSKTKKVTISSLNKRFYSKRLKVARRLVK